MTGQGDQPLENFLFDRALEAHDVEDLMIAEIDRVLDYPARTDLPAGTVLFDKGQRVDGIWLLLEGNVRLFQMIDGEELVFHEQTVGPIIGLLAFASQAPATFSCRAVTPITVVRLPAGQLESALRASTHLQGHFVTVLLRVLAGRQQRSIEQGVEIRQLNRQLAEERDELATALRSLQQAQLRLVESEKMATLGELAAGVAHDLNNPATAIQRWADFLSEDIFALADRSRDPEWTRRVLSQALTREPLSTRDERQFRKSLADAVSSDDLARRLTRAGITTPDAFAAEFGDRGSEEIEARLSEREALYGVGSALRSIEAGAVRIGALVASLRAHARPARELSPDVDINESIDESLLLLGHRLSGIDVELRFGQLPAVSAYPSELGQLWTNLVSNAVEAMGDSGRLVIVTDQPDNEHVRVKITDSGAGIPSESLDQIFDINYTTKQGRVEFGLGLGLTITAQIVRRHNGTIDVDSQPGRTSFTIVLPITPGDSA